MSQELKRLLIAQRYTFDWIAKVITNYKNLSKEIVTYEYTKKRLDSVKERWMEAQGLAIDIEFEVTEEDRKTLPYFVEHHYSKAKSVYEEAVDYLVDALNKFNEPDISEYEAKQSQIQSHLESIICFPPMKSENLVQLKRLRDTVATARAALANLGSPVEHWDQIIVFIMELKFSPQTKREWDRNLGNSRECASYEEMYEFLTVYARILSHMTALNEAKPRVEPRPSVDGASTCVNCAGSHNLPACEDFLSRSIAQRSALVKKKKACFNCLRPGHFKSECLSLSRCTHCHLMHHSLLHREG